MASIDANILLRLIVGDVPEQQTVYMDSHGHMDITI